MAKKFPARYAESTLKRMYGKLNADEKTVGLLRDYFNAMANLYGIIPIKKVCEIITEQNKDSKRQIIYTPTKNKTVALSKILCKSKSNKAKDSLQGKHN